MKKTFYSFGTVNTLIAAISWGLVISLFRSMSSNNFAIWEPYFLYSVVLLVLFVTVFSMQFITFKEDEIILTIFPLKTTIKYNDIIKITKEKPKNEMHTYIYITYSNKKSQLRKRVISLDKKPIEDEIIKRMITVYEDTTKKL